MKQKLLVSVRGKKEAIEAYKGGADIIDVEFPASALGTPYPLNIMTVRRNLPANVLVSTNIGEEQILGSTACQSAIGVAIAGADIIKAGLAKMNFNEALQLGRNIVRSIRRFCSNKQIIPVVFADSGMRSKYIDPVVEGPELASLIKADGVLVDTFDKSKDKGICNYLTNSEIKKFVKECHKKGIEAWIAGSITLKQLPKLKETGVNVICIRGSACKDISTKGRFGIVDSKIVATLKTTITKR